MTDARTDQPELWLFADYVDTLESSMELAFEGMERQLIDPGGDVEYEFHQNPNDPDGRKSQSRILDNHAGTLRQAVHRRYRRTERSFYEAQVYYKYHHEPDSIVPLVHEYLWRMGYTRAAQRLSQGQLVVPRAATAFALLVADVRSGPSLDAVPASWGPETRMKVLAWSFLARFYQDQGAALRTLRAWYDAGAVSGDFVTRAVTQVADVQRRPSLTAASLQATVSLADAFWGGDFADCALRVLTRAFVALFENTVNAPAMFSALQNGYARDLPLDLPTELRFHSYYVCPITRSLADNESGVFVMACGHLLSKDAVEMSVDGRCPFCQRASPAQKVTLH